MKAFVVTDDAMRGVQFVSVHRAWPDATSGQAVHEVTVMGPQSEPDVVYIAQTYDRSMDTHNYAGVYGNYDDARSASGSKGSPLQKKI